MFIKKALLGSIGFAVALAATGVNDAAAQTPCGDRPYIAVRSGVAMLKNHIKKNAWEGSVAMGMQLDAMRAELDYTYRDKIKKQHAGREHENDTMSLMVNGYYDIPTDMALKPFVNLGIGASRLKMKVADVSSKTHYKFSWAGGVGVGYELSRDWTLDVGYRFQDLGKDVKSNEFYGGVRFAF